LNSTSAASFSSISSLQLRVAGIVARTEFNGGHPQPLELLQTSSNDIWPSRAVKTPTFMDLLLQNISMPEYQARSGRAICGIDFIQRAGSTLRLARITRRTPMQNQLV
jgi:hypothetical protein